MSRVFTKLLPLLRITLAFLLSSSALYAHRAFEITSDARLQHGRLELRVILSPTIGNLLLRDPTQPEAPDLNASTIDRYRPRLLALAAHFYELHDGKSLLKPTQISVEINRTQEPEFIFIYPAPTAGPLKVRVVGLSAPGPEGINILRIYDDNEHMLTGKLLTANGANSEVALPFPTPATSPSTSPKPTSTAQPTP